MNKQTGQAAMKRLGLFFRLSRKNGESVYLLLVAGAGAVAGDAGALANSGLFSVAGFVAVSD